MNYSIADIIRAEKCIGCEVLNSIRIYLKPDAQKRPIENLDEGVTIDEVCQSLVVIPTETNYNQILEKFSIVF